MPAQSLKVPKLRGLGVASKTCNVRAMSKIPLKIITRNEAGPTRNEAGPTRNEAGFAEPFIIALLSVAAIWAVMVGIGLLTPRETGNVPVCVASTFKQHAASLGDPKSKGSQPARRRVGAYCRCLDDHQMTTEEQRKKLNPDQQKHAFAICTGRSLSCTPETTSDGKTIALGAKAQAYCACLKGAGLDPAKLANAPAAKQRSTTERCLKEAQVPPLTFVIDTSIPVF